MYKFAYVIFIYRMHLLHLFSGQMVLGVTSRRVLDNIRSSANGPLLRVHLANRCDIHNIKKSHGISSSSAVEPVASNLSDAESIHAWVVSCQARREDNPVVLYKQQGEELIGVRNDEFLLGLVTPFQQKMLQKFGSDRILIDSTHGITGHDFMLTTVMVVDEYEEGIPAAFLVSARTDTSTLVQFFNALKCKAGSLHCAVFMSDDDSAFYNAWAEVMGAPRRRLLCSWHVDRAWSGKLNMIADKQTKEAMYKALKICQTELSAEKFSACLESLQYVFADKSPEFCAYFASYYGHRVEQWAYCHRIGCRLNTNMRIERFHRELKHNYLEGKTVKRMDRTIEALFSLVNRKLHDRLEKLEKGKLTYKVAHLYEQHRKGSQLVGACLQINATTVQVPSATAPECSYTAIQRLPNHTCSDGCMRCRYCCACDTSWSCSCVDFAVHAMICRHIHAACILLHGSRSTHDASNAVVAHTGVREEIQSYQSALETACRRPVCGHVPRIEKLLSELSVLVRNIGSDPDDMTAAMVSHLEMVKRLCHMKKARQIAKPYQKSAKQYRSHRKVTPQKRFISVRKKRQSRQNLSKAWSVEAGIIKRSLLGEEEVADLGVNELEVSDNVSVSSFTLRTTNSMCAVETDASTSISTSNSTDCDIREILLTDTWLDDRHMLWVMKRLKLQFPNVEGLESTALCQVTNIYLPCYCAHCSQTLKTVLFPG